MMVFDPGGVMMPRARAGRKPGGTAGLIASWITGLAALSSGAVSHAGTIQSAIDAADDGDVVVIEPGTYAESIDFNGKAITLCSAIGPEETIIDGRGLDATVVTFDSGEGAGSVLVGFTITNGAAGRGAGMYVGTNVSPIVIDCRFVDNEAMIDGGGCFNDGGNPTFIACHFLTNVAADPSPASTMGSGAGFASIAGAPMLIGCSFDQNVSELVGGAVALSEDDGVIRNCTFRANGAVFDGGAIFVTTASTTTIVNCAFSGNVAQGGGGGGVVTVNSDITLKNCTLARNSAAAGGGMASSNSDPVLINCVLWANTATVGPQIFNDGSVPIISFSDIQGSGGSGGSWATGLGIDGGGNIDADPMLVDDDGKDDIPGSPDDDLRLLGGSPCIDAGDNTAVDDCHVDIEGQARRVDDEATPDTGQGDAPIVDMGADEFAATAADCNGNSTDDACDLLDGSSPDCNENGVPDECDVVEGSNDLNDNGIPDECEPDCNGNGIPDDLDIAGKSNDVNGNGIPDECELDCNENGVPDEVDLAEGDSLDCNNNGVPDECDIGEGISSDEDGDGVPDECAERGVGFTRHVITDTADSALAVCVADLDGDDDTDVISASRDDDTVAWYENDGASPPSFTVRTLSTNVDGAAAVFAADLDADDDVDVIVAARNADRISWFENVGGVPPVFVERTISDSADAPFAVFAADIDGDDHMDVLSASRNDDTVAWYENDGNQPPSFTTRIVSQAIDGPIAVWAANLDGDGDVDVLTAAFDGSEITWFENVGGTPPAFAPRLIGDAAEATGVLAATIDGDAHVDVVSASRADNTIAWYENDGGSPPVFTRRVISTAALGARSVATADIDGDDDTDVIAASVADDTISWFEQLPGEPPQFAEHIITIDARSAQAAVAGDVDGDGDQDVVSASRADDTIAWFENEALCCRADINDDGVVDVDDLVAVILAWGVCPVPPPDCPADIDGSGVVDVDDLLALILNWTT
jgi:hypothetical protein